METLFQKYSAAFDALNASAITDLYTYPCATADGDGAKVFSTREQLCRKFTDNCESMSDMGYQHSQFTVLDIIDMDETTKTAILGWRVQLQNSTLEFKSLYVCHKQNEAWKIFSANVYAGQFDTSPQ